MHTCDLIDYETTDHYDSDYMTGVAGTLWEEIALFCAMKAGNREAQIDPEAKRDDNDKWPKGACIMLGPRMYTDVQLGMLDGPARYKPKADPNPELLAKRTTPKARMTKRQRAKLRRAERRAARRAAR